MEIPGGRIIDLHAHLWQGREDSDAEGLIDEARDFGAEYVAVSHLWGRQPTPEQVRQGNDVTAAWEKRSGRLLRAQATLNPRHGPGALEELARCYETHGIRMVKLWTAARCIDPCVFPVIERCIELDVPVLQHAFFKANGNGFHETIPQDVAALARRYPEAKIVMAHVAGDYIRGTWAIRDTPNVRTDISGSYCEAGMVDTAVRELGPERLIFGSDNGIAFNLGKVQDALISEEAKARVLYDNAKEWLP